MMLAKKLKYSEKNLFQCHFVHHKLQMDWHRIEPGHIFQMFESSVFFLRIVTVLTSWIVTVNMPEMLHPADIPILIGVVSTCCFQFHVFSLCAVLFGICSLKFFVLWSVIPYHLLFMITWN